MGASGYAPSTPSNGMAWQFLLGPEIFSQRTRAARSSTLYTTQESRAPSSDLNGKQTMPHGWLSSIALSKLR